MVKDVVKSKCRMIDMWSYFQVVKSREKTKKEASQLINAYLSRIQDKKKTNGTYLYPDLNSFKRLIDIPAKSVYATFLRLTRNEVAHPSQLKVEKSEALVLYISYLKYCEIQHKYLVFYQNNS